MEELQEEWQRNLFRALTTERVSRNKFPDTFAEGWSRDVHRRFKTLRALKRDAERLAEIAGSVCWVSDGDEGLRIHLHCPSLLYSRVVAVYGYELEWLMAQRGVRALLDVRTLESRSGVEL